MNDDRHKKGLDRAYEIDAACGDFERAWRKGLQPDIAEYVRGVAADLQQPVLMELLHLERDLRLAIGEKPSPDEYLQRFPERAAAINLVFAGISSIEETIIESGKSDSVVPAVGTGIRYFGEYELLEEIARGGMGVVFKARQVKLNRVVALKMILSGSLAGDEEVRRFQTEAEAAANLDHPGIVPIYEIGEHYGQHYFSMGFVEGQSLADRVKDGPLPPREAAAVVQKVTAAIAYAHSSGVIHRDLKPANVLLDANGEPKVSDFGLAKQLKSDSDLTRTGAVMGTPNYMPPEQAAGNTDEIGPRSDVYSIGAVLYCLLTARPPFQTENPIETLKLVTDRSPVPPGELNPGIPRDLETICLKCLEKELSRRYQSADELVEDLNRFQVGMPILAKPVSAFEHCRRWCARHVLLATLSAMLAVVITVAAALLTVAYLREARYAEEMADLASENADLVNLERDARQEAETLSQQRKELIADLDSALTESRKLRSLSFVAYGRTCSLASKIANLSESVIIEAGRGHQVSAQARLQFDAESAILKLAAPVDVVNEIKRFSMLLETDDSQEELKKQSLRLARACGAAWRASTEQTSQLRETIRNNQYRQICHCVDKLTNANDFKDVQHFYQQFWELYWGELAIVETKIVESAMVKCGNAIKAWRTGPPPKELVSAADELYEACQIPLHRETTAD